jgi:regulator of protease activity HflC (stomatin/prohibitin superfamily)
MLSGRSTGSSLMGTVCCCFDGLYEEVSGLHWCSVCTREQQLMVTVAEILAGTAVEVVIFGVAGAVIYRVWRSASFLPQRMKLMPFSKGVILEGDRLVKIVDSGSYWIMPRQTMVAVDIRPRPVQMAARELLTSDNQGIRIRFNGEYRVTDPASFVSESSDGHAAFYLSLEREIGSAVAELERAEMLGARVFSADRVRERMEPRAAQLGIAIIHLEASDLVPIAWAQQSQGY